MRNISDYTECKLMREVIANSMYASSTIRIVKLKKKIFDASVYTVYILLSPWGLTFFTRLTTCLCGTDISEVKSDIWLQ